MANKVLDAAPKWLDKYPVVDADHLQGLEQDAAIHEFGHKMPRHEAEARAHSEYRTSQLSEAAAHHLVGLTAAHAAGATDDAKKHAAMYGVALKALGHDDVMNPPPEVASKAKHTPAEVYKFRAHKGDAFALPEHKEETEEKKD
jgi:hypothetical protein